MYYVYILTRPNGKAFYVGKGSGKRVFQHEPEAKSGHKCHKCNVIRKIWRGGGQVQRYTVFTTDDETEALAYERTLIALLGRHTLTNQDDGGGGLSNPDPILRERLRAAVRAQWKNNDERRAATSKRTKEQWNDPAYRAKMRAVVQSEQWHTRQLEGARSPENREKSRMAMAQQWQDPEFRAKMIAMQNAPERRRQQSEQAKQQMQDPEFRARVRVGSSKKGQDPAFQAARISQLQSPEYRAKMRQLHSDPEKRAQRSADKRAQWQDPEFRAKMIAAQKAAHARKRTPPADS